jgi:hypothetical protein
VSESATVAPGRVAPSDLVDARLQVHHAAQLVSAVGVTLLPPAPDDSHPNLGWHAGLGALLGRPVPAAGGAQAGLRVAELELVVPGGPRSESLALDGRTLEAARAWLSGAIARRGAAVPDAGLALPGYGLPAHATAGGAAFARRPAEAFAELACWFAFAERALTALATRSPGASEVRCWPHHFDIATLITLERGPDGGATRSIGAGLGPGDPFYAEPYWYVTPWPRPEKPEFPPLPGGAHWRTEHFTAAILPGSVQVAAGDAPAQSRLVGRFLDAAVAACRRL